MYGKENGEWRAYTSSECALRVKLTALGLYALGVRPGDRVALIAENSPQWIIADQAVMSIGAATVPVYTTQMASQVGFILSDAGVRVCLVSSDQLLQRFRSVLGMDLMDEVILFVRPAGRENIRVLDDVRALGNDLDRSQPSLYDELRGSVDAGTAASVIYTSGTTGEPKGVVLTHANMLSNAVDTGSVLELSEKDTALSYLPLTHIFERMIISMYLYLGVTIYFSESMDAVPKNLRSVQPTVLTTVPRLLEKILAGICAKGEELTGVKRSLFAWALRLARTYDPAGARSLTAMLRRLIASVVVFSQWRQALGGRVRFIISGGASLAPGLARVYCAAGMPVLQGYGLTETSPVLTVNRYHHNKLGSVGQAIPHVTLKVAVDGEILARGPNVMQGFLNAPEQTSLVMNEGWFATGDLGYIDAEGFLFLTDRKKDLIKNSSGKTVAPAPIELRLQSSAFIEYAALAGEARKYITAMIFPNFTMLKKWADGKGLVCASTMELLTDRVVIELYQGIVDETNASFNTWEQITKFTLIDAELSVATGDITPTLKVRRRNVTEKYHDRIEAMYT
jgi:long-chain acyl-CoA synthetase